MRRDKKIAAQFTAGGITGLLMTILFFIRGIYPIEILEYNYAIGLSPGILVLYGFFWRKSITWILTGSTLFTTLEGTMDTLYISLWKISLQCGEDAESTAIIYLLVPSTLFVFLVSTYFWGVYSIFYVLPGLVLSSFIYNYISRTRIWSTSFRRNGRR